MSDEVASLDENKIVAAILAAAWYQKNSLEQGANNRDQFVREYLIMLDTVRALTGPR